MSDSKLKNLSMEFSADIVELVKYLKSICYTTFGQPSAKKKYHN